MIRLNLLGMKWWLHNQVSEESWLWVLPGTYLRMAHLYFNSIFTLDNFTQASIHRPDSFHSYVISAPTWKYSNTLKKGTWRIAGVPVSFPGSSNYYQFLVHAPPQLYCNANNILQSAFFCITMYCGKYCLDMGLDLHHCFRRSSLFHCVCAYTKIDFNDSH